MDKFVKLLKKKEQPFTLDQLWYFGMPNMARYCLWPILIGNSLKIERWTFDSFKI